MRRVNLFYLSIIGTYVHIGITSVCLSVCCIDTFASYYSVMCDCNLLDLVKQLTHSDETNLTTKLGLPFAFELE